MAFTMHLVNFSTGQIEILVENREGINAPLGILGKHILLHCIA